jgi:hypothetical protein
MIDGAPFLSAVFHADLNLNLAWKLQKNRPPPRRPRGVFSRRQIQKDHVQNNSGEKEYGCATGHDHNR